MQVSPPLALLLLAIAFGAAGTALRAYMWSRGRPARVSVIWGLLSVPKRYLVDVHDVTMRDRPSARMHMFAAGGFLSSIVAIIVVYSLPVGDNIAALLFLPLSILMIGAGLAIRRRIHAPSNLSRGAFRRMPFALAAFAGFYCLTTASMIGFLPTIDWMSPAGLALLMIGGFGSMELIAGLSGGPIKHSINGALHLAFHPRPNRFLNPQMEKALRPIDLEGDKLGVETARDFEWNRLLAFDACVECGKCEAVCPAFSAGLPLNPKALVQDLLRTESPLIQFPYAGSSHPGGREFGSQNDFASHKPILGSNGIILPETIWSCTTCRACVEACPMMIEHVDAIVDLRRFETLEKGRAPGKAAEVLTNLRETDNQVGASAEERSDWLSDLDVSLLRTAKQCETLLWLGGGAFEWRTRQSIRSLIKLLNAARIDFAILGDEELDVGDTARRLGDEATFQRLARANIEVLSRYTFDRIVTPDPHSYHCLKNEYTDFGGTYTVLHHADYLMSLVDEGRLQFDTRTRSEISYHDPCYLARYNDVLEAPRSLLDAAGYDIRELTLSRKKTFCCGGGGGAPVADITGRRRIADVRMDQVHESGTATVAVSCPGCTVMLEGASAPRPTVADISELLLERLKGAQ